MGVMREAMALRVKYRLKNSLGGKIDKKNSWCVPCSASTDTTVGATIRTQARYSTC